MIKFVDEYRNPALCLKASEKIKAISKKKIRIMEVCGGHTMAIRKNGLNKLVGGNITFISGPGCPVCVTALQDVDTAIALSKLEGITVCTFGDLFYVPGSSSSLAESKSEGADVRVVYSADDALNLAGRQRDKKVVFISIGFETTAPTAAAAILRAQAEGLDNFYILALNKTMPAALRAILGSGDTKIDALICPGHVSTITGIEIYRFIVEEFKIPCCVCGFEPLDIMTGVYILAGLSEENKAELVNAYKRVVRDEGNKKARSIMREVFEKADAPWRGIGVIPSSGLRLRSPYKRFAARERFNIDVPPAKENPGCICGEVLRGIKRPADCPLFAKTCSPSRPQGACMVSSEGICSAWYKYGD